MTEESPMTMEMLEILLTAEEEVARKTTEMMGIDTELDLYEEFTIRTINRLFTNHIVLRVDLTEMIMKFWSNRALQGMKEIAIEKEKTHVR